MTRLTLAPIGLLLASALSGAGISIGARAPDQNLTAVDGSVHSLRSLEQAPVTLLIFLSAECPVSNEYVGRMNAIVRDYAGRATVLGVNSNRNETTEQVRQHAADYRLAFPVYKDPDNVLADALGISVTPQAVVFDAEQKLRYRGRIDDSQKSPRVTRSDVRLALDAILAGKPVSTPETKAFGCTIKRVQR